MPSSHSASPSAGSRRGSYRGRHAHTSSSSAAWLGQTAPILGIALASGAAIGALAERPGLPASPASHAAVGVSAADPAIAAGRTTAAGRSSRSDPGPDGLGGAVGKAGSAAPAASTVWSLVGPVDEPSVATAERRVQMPSAEVKIDLPEPADVSGAPIPPVPGCDAIVNVAVSVLNGQLGDEHLCPIGEGHQLRPDAAAAFLALDAAYHNATGERLCVTDSYRSLGAQITLLARKPGLAARPGTSEHGWGLALDIGCGVNSFDGAAHTWMTKNAPGYGWVNPEWAQADGAKPEPWHWEFTPDLLD